MDDSVYLNHLGLSDGDLRDYITKFSAFYNSLNDAQKRFAEKAKPTTDLSAVPAALGSDATPQSYRSFLAQRGVAPSDMCCWAPGD